MFIDESFGKGFGKEDGIDIGRFNLLLGSHSSNRFLLSVRNGNVRNLKNRCKDGRTLKNDHFTLNMPAPGLNTNFLNCITTSTFLSSFCSSAVVSIPTFTFPLFPNVESIVPFLSNFDTVTLIPRNIDKSVSFLNISFIMRDWSLWTLSTIPRLSFIFTTFRDFISSPFNGLITLPANASLVCFSTTLSKRDPIKIDCPGMKIDCSSSITA